MSNGRLLNCLWLICWLLCASQMPAQPAFRLHPLGDGLALSAGLGLTLAGYRLNQQLLPLSPANLQGLNTSGLPRIDRFATAYYRPSVAAVSDWIAVAAVAVPAICLRSAYIRQRLPTVGLMAAEGALWTSGLTLLTKGLTQRLRPYVYNAAVAPEEKMTADSRRSYFSGHVAMAAYTTFAGASLYSQVYPDRRAKWVIWAAAALLPAATAWGRVYSGKHFLTDVVTGYAVGAGVGLLTVRLHRSRPGLATTRGQAGYR